MQCNHDKTRGLIALVDVEAVTLLPDLTMKLARKKRWQRFRQDQPGERFQNHYHRRQQEHKHPAVKMLFIGAGALIFLGGVALIPIPGPSIFMFFIGAGLIAQESRWAARALDRIEFRLRLLSSWAGTTWHRAPMLVKLMLVVVTVVVLGAVGIQGYLIFIES